MDEPSTFLLPIPDFSKKSAMESKPPIYLTPSGMTLLPREKQPPPMYGPKGTTIPPRYLAPQRNLEEKPQERRFCEPCEMELQSLNDFRRHRAQHENCPIEGCSYKAHPSVMDKHVTELHNSGIFEKIKRTSTPEEIAAWREERRKKYPTVANAEMRKLALEQRQRRGERLEDNKSRFGRQEDRKRARNVDVIKDQRAKVPRHNQHDGRTKGKEKGFAKKIVKEEKQTPIVPLKVAEETIPCRMRPFAGTSKMKDYQHEKEKKPQTVNVLSTMLGMYGSDDEEDDDEEEEERNLSLEVEKEILNEPTQTSKEKTDISDPEEIAIESKSESASLTERTPPTETQSELESIIKDILNIEKDESTTQKIAESAVEFVPEDKPTQDSSDEAPDEAPIGHSDSITCPIPSTSTSTKNLNGEASLSKSSKQQGSKGRQKQKRKYGLNYRKIRLRRQNTMLEKLLEPDIRHERNVFLQCVRFVCQNNFFGIGSKNNSTGDE